jgi:hypothetical protein
MKLSNAWKKYTETIMKLNKNIWKFREKPEDGTIDVHFCKKCGDELPSTSEYESCDGCRREQGKTIRKGFGVVLSLLALGVVKIFTNRKL